MLVLTQKEGEVLQIGDDVRIYIKRIKGNWVRLCIEAPKDVALVRIPVKASLTALQELDPPAASTTATADALAPVDPEDTQE